MRRIVLPCRSSRRLAAFVLAGASFAGVFAAAARAEDRPHTVTFVNDSDKDLYVHVRTGSSGEVGSCEAKASEATFELRSKEKKPVDSQNTTVCYCSRRSDEGPIMEKRDCAKQWKRAASGAEVHVR
jgi:hypothetical protein